MVNIVVNDREIKAEKGDRLLKACLDNDIFVPNLCFLKEMKNPPASCRLCFVEIDGVKDPVSSCEVKVNEGLRVYTNTPQVRKLQWAAFEFIMSAHRIDCGTCSSSKNCVLIKISRYLKIRLKPIRIENVIRTDESEDHPYLIYDRSKCILCGKCIYRCSKLYKHSYLTFAGRGLDTAISFFGETDPESIPCKNCLACVDECPVSALISYKKYQDVINES